ncbi:MAG: hypothetical protein IKN49_05960 [Elusimicrobiaceae bacterium]|nr:hypothetical protein [Elusimicrobiaceae bacterium]
MKKLMLLCCVVSMLLSACVKPEDESSSKFNRQANIEKYMKKAKTLSQMDQERQKPLDIVAPLDVSHLTKNTQTVDLDFLTESFERNRQSLQNRLQEKYTQRNGTRLEQLADQYRNQIRQAIQDASSPAELEEKVNQALADQEKSVKELMDQTDTANRLKPDQQSLDRAAQRLQHRCEDFANRMELYYGPETAAAVRPVLDKAIEDFEYAMASAANEKELNDKLAQILLFTRQQIQQVTEETADPAGITSEDEITALRSEMITTHQQLENRIEYLYGKEAVLQARKPFNRLLEDAGNTLRENMRLSQKKNTLERFNAHYKDSLLDLQEQWNKELAQMAKSEGA